MALPTSVIVENVLPFLDRVTFDSCRLLSRDIFHLSQHISNPPWPSNMTCSQWTEKREIACLTVSDRALAMGCETGDVIVVVKRNMRRFLFKGHSSMAIVSIQFSPDETYLATGSVDGSMRLWCLHKPNCSFWEDAISTTNSKRTSSSSVSSSSQACTNTGGLQEYTCPFLLLDGGHIHPVHSLVFTPDSQTLISAAHETTVLLWNVRTTTGEFSGRIVDRWEHMDYVCVSPDGLTLAACGWNGSVQLFSLSDNGRYRGRVLESGFPISTLQFSDDGKSLFGFQGREMQVWDVKNNGKLDTWSLPLFPMESRKPQVTAVALSRQANHVAFCTKDGRVLVYNIRIQDQRLWNGCEVCHEDKIISGQYQLAFSPDGRTLIAAHCHGGSLRFGEILM